MNPAAPATPPLVIRCYAASDIGRVRACNQDQGYAGPSLLAVADGFGTAGDAASAAVIDALRPLESGTLPDGAPDDLLNILSDAAASAAASVRSLAAADPAAAGSGSTLTAMYWTGSRLAMVHIGDGRAYLLRDDGLFQITHDHSVVQSLIDAGKLTPEEAASHPRRSLLLRAINAAPGPDGGDAGETPSPGAGTPDLSLHDAQAGDRYLLCSDGLTSVVPAAVIRETLSQAGSSPESAVRRLIELANEAGGPDNIACAVADVIPAG